MTKPGSGVRLSELLAALSLGIDLGMGHPMEHVLRQSFIALRLADRLGLDAQQRHVVYYSSLLAWVGCHVDAYEQAKWFGDDQALKHQIRWVDQGRPTQVATFLLRRLGSGRPLAERARLAATFPAEGRRILDEIAENHWRTVDALMVRLKLDPTIRACVGQTFERWDGRGDPDGLRGADLQPATRLVNLADVAEVFHHAGGVAAAVAVARERRGTQFDPDLVDLFCDQAGELFAELDAVTSWKAVMTVEPHLDQELRDDELDDALAAIADFVDLKSPYTLGHSRGVAELAARAAAELGVTDHDKEVIRRAALVHDVGRLGVSNAIWDKPDRLTAGDWERVRLHPYLSERMLASCPALSDIASVAGQHHERLDGSGYPGGLTGGAITVGGRVLGAADAYRARLEERPHRPAAEPTEAAAMLREEARRGRLDGEAVEAVLRADGHRARRRRPWPAGLTTREVEILRLVARGLSHQDIAARLVISRKTASNHVERIYVKIGARNRAMAALFAVKHGLVDET